MRRPLVVLGLVGGAAGAIAWWRRNPRIGTQYVNRVIDPWLMRSGVIERSEGELALVEHVGRVSGTVRVTPVHPVATPTGYRVIVPLGAASQWARNVLAAGHCRLQVGGVVHDLDEPTLVSPIAMAEIPSVVAHVMDWLGFRYLQLHRFAEREGDLATLTFPGRLDAHVQARRGAQELVAT
jgi:deazaflavin-dependent oxidoreductase (nitroreductase family)